MGRSLSPTETKPTERGFAPLFLLDFIMATIKILKPREQAAHFGLYRTSVGGDDSIFVRRKIADPTDYLHSKSRKLANQRYFLTLASQHYANLTPGQKATTRRQIDWVEFQKSHGKTDTKLLMGRQLFIAREMRSLATTGKQLMLPHELCIMLVDPTKRPLVGELWLRYLEDEEWHDVFGQELAPGNWLFKSVPPEKEAYRPYGEAPGYYDQQLPQYQNMTEDKIRAYHYHKLSAEYPLVCFRQPAGYAARILRQGTKFSQPLMPYSTFHLEDFWVCLMRRPDPYYTPPATGFISIHLTTQDIEPIDPPIAKVSFDLSLPLHSTHYWHRIPFSSLELHAHTIYAWVIGCPGDYDWYKAVNVRIGEYGLCNLDPSYQRWKSRCYEGSWLPWEEDDPFKMFYEARGEILD